MMLLSTPQRWDWAQVDVAFRQALPDPGFVQSVHMVAINADATDEIIVCRVEGANTFELPGGTREPEESILDCLAREMVEETGAELVETPIAVGAHWAKGYREVPYRPHLPHPFKAWLWCVGRVRIAGRPTSPPSGEQIAELRSLATAHAARLLAVREAWYPELIQTALLAWEHADPAESLRYLNHA